MGQVTAEHIPYVVIELEATRAQQLQVEGVSLITGDNEGTRLGRHEILAAVGAGGPAVARALDNLEQALAADSQMMAWLGQDRIFDPLRSEPRFVALLRKLRLSRE